MNASHKPIPIQRIHDSILAVSQSPALRDPATAASARTNTSESFLFLYISLIIELHIYFECETSIPAHIVPVCVGCRLSIACTAHSICVSTTEK